MTCMYKGNKYPLVRNITTNVKNIYGLENQFPSDKFMDNTVQFVHKTWGGVWVVIAISSISSIDNAFQNVQLLSQVEIYYFLYTPVISEIVKYTKLFAKILDQ